MDGHEMLTQRMLAKKSPPVHLSYTGNENRLKGYATKTSDDTDRHCAQQNSATSWTADADSEMLLPPSARLQYPQTILEQNLLDHKNKCLSILM